MYKLISIVLFLIVRTSSAESNLVIDCDWVPVDEAIEAVSSSLSTSRTLHQKRYQQLLEETDFKLDAAVITLSKVLPLIKDEEAKRRAEDYLGFVKRHRAAYPSVAEKSPHFEEALEYLQKLDVPESEPSASSDNISERLNELSNKLHAK
jgi:hypothetical protein